MFNSCKNSSLILVLLPKLIRFEYKIFFVNSLFSYNKGLFVYTPICFLSLFSFITFVLEKKYFQLLVSFFFLSITVYFLSAWYQWQYGWSFGLRAYIDFFPVFALLIGMLILSIRSFILKIIIVTCPENTTNDFQNGIVDLLKNKLLNNTFISLISAIISSISIRV